MKSQVQADGVRLQRWKERTTAALHRVLVNAEVKQFGRIEASAARFPSPTVLRNDLRNFGQYLRALIEEAQDHPEDFAKLRLNRPIVSSITPNDATPPVSAESRGAPRAVVPPTPATRVIPLEYPEKVTLEWLWHHVPWSFWLSAIIVLLSTFLLGMAIGSGKSFPEILELLRG